MKARLLLALVTLGPLAACGRSPVRLETRTFALHYLDRREAQQILSPYVYGDRPGAQGAMSAGDNTLTVRETPDNLERIARVLAQFDRPAPSVRLTFKLIRADGAARPDSSIREVESALRSLFRFQGYALVAEGIVTGSQQSGSRQTLEGSGGPYSLEAFVERVGTGGDSAVVNMNVHLVFRGGEFRTTVGIPVGKTAVLGNVQGGSASSALILTVRPDLLN
jgi:hypothetical protein